jgi:hypothetical protein
MIDARGLPEGSEIVPLLNLTNDACPWFEAHMFADKLE